MYPLCFGDEHPPLTDDEKAIFSDNYLVPSPNELFSALNKLGQGNWNTIVSAIKAEPKKKKIDYTDRKIQAMNLGIRVTDGLMGVAAKDKSLIEDLAPVIQSLARKLNVKKNLISVGDKVKELARQEKWPEVTHELDKLQASILQEMIDQRDHDSAKLGSLAGWLEGLHLVSKSLTENYNEEASQLLRQVWLVNNFLKEIEKLEGTTKSKQYLSHIEDGMKQIKKLVDVDKEQPISKENIKKLYEISKSLIEEIERS
jgi:predicted nucleic acid-binding protein